MTHPSAEREPAPAMPYWLERMVPATRYRVRLGDVRMHVMESGRGRPVLMIHGNPTWGFLYRRVARALEGESFRVIVPDLIGLGFSDKPGSSSVHTLVNHTGWLARLVDVLALDEVILVVQDWGGAIGLGAMRGRVEHIAGLVVLNTVLSEPKSGFKPTAFHRLAHLPGISDLLFRGLGFPQRVLALAQGDWRSIRGEVARAYTFPLTAPAARVAPLALARMVPDSLAHPSIPLLRECRHVVESYRGPAAIVWGERDPVLGRVRSWIEKLLPQATVSPTPAGHFVPEEVPFVIADAVRRVAHAR